jgi:2-phospho-L-lactate transferase/gluconeogenesis factor (CofD/UPF0052 family)
MINIVIFNGGRGAGTIIPALQSIENIKITSIVNAYDDGKSTGEIRRFFNMLGPSDIRKVQQLMLPKGDPDFESNNWLFEYRFPSNIPSNVIRSKLIQEISSKKHSLYGNRFQNLNVLNQVKFFLRSFISNLELIEKGSSSKKFNFQDCSLVNCIYAGAFIFYKRNIEFASLEIEKLFNLTGSVLPTSLENKKLVGMRRNGEMLYSEAEIVELRSNVSIDRVFLLDDYPKREYFKNLSTSQKKAYLQNHETYVESSSRSKFAIKSADIIIYSAGTQHSSLYPTYLTRGLARAISDNKNALKIFITNIGADYETPKYKAHNYIEGAYKYLCLSESRNFKISEFFSHILINKSSRQKKVNYVKILSKPLRTFPFKVIIDDFEDNLQPGKHDGSKLVKKIISIYKNSK